MRFVRIVYALIGLVVLLIFLEEVSWGQWLFGFETPAAISSKNQQQEFNFHNLYIVDQVDEVFAPLILVAIVMTLARLYLEAGGELTPTADLVLPDIYMLAPLVFSFLLSAFLASSALRAAIEARGILDLRYPLEQEVQETFISLSALAYGVGRLRVVRAFNQGGRAALPPPSESALRVERQLALAVLRIGSGVALVILVAAFAVVGMIGKDRVFPPAGVRVVNGCAVQPGAQCPGVELGGLDLRGVDLSGANMPFASLRGADLSGADLSGANLNGADLTGVNLSNASLVGTVFQGAEMAEADLTDADLTASVVTFANLYAATVAEQQLADALQHFQGTTLPDGYQCENQTCSGSYLSP